MFIFIFCSSKSNFLMNTSYKYFPKVIPNAGIYPSNLMLGTRYKNFNLLIEFSNSILIKFDFKAYWR